MEDIHSLLLKHLRAETTEEEQTTINAWLATSQANRELFAELNDPEQVARSLEKMDQMREDQVWQRLQAHSTDKFGVGDAGTEELAVGQSTRSAEVPASPRQRTVLLRWQRWAAAAVIFILLGTGLFWRFHNNPPTSLALTQQQRFLNDVPPGKNAAVLTLASGQKIILDSTSTGTITRQGNATITNAKGQLVYMELQKKPAEVLYNTLTTGRGNQYQLTLPDGSKVWLNAASSITYPATFTGSERKVAITGEAYFEIAKDERHPFIVQRKQLNIQVLGTHFNVNTYEDEDAMKTTLLEGSVRVAVASETSILQPGQQAIVSRNNAPIKVADHPDIDEVMAWKNRVFKFNDATIEMVMREMARWYDVQVVYETRISQHFIADIPRDVPVSELLKLLELTDQVHFKIEGKKITVIR